MPAGHGERLRGFSPSCVRYENKTSPQTYELRSSLAGRRGVRGLSRPRALGTGRWRGPFALTELPDDGGTTLRTCLAGIHRIQFAQGVGVRPNWHPRIPAPVK